MRMLAAVTVALIMISSVVLAQPQPPAAGDAVARQELAAAWRRLEALKSYRRKMGLSPRMAGADKMRLVTETVNPNRTRMVLDMENMITVEFVQVGQEFRRRITLKGALAQQYAQLAAQNSPQNFFDQMGGILGLISAIANPMEAVIGVVATAVQGAIMNHLADRFGASFRPGTWECMPPQAESFTPPSLSEVARSTDTTIEGTQVRGYDVTSTEQRGGRAVTTKMRFYVLTDRQLPRRIERFDASGSLEGVMDFYDFDAPITIELPPCER